MEWEDIEAQSKSKVSMKGWSIKGLLENDKLLQVAKSN